MRFPLRAFSSEDQEKAIASVRKAARWVRRGAVDKAIEAYKTAVALDANSWSRYELMTTYLRAGERRAALGMLKELREWVRPRTRPASINRRRIDFFEDFQEA